MVRLSRLVGAHRSLHAVFETACFATPVVSPKCLLGLCLDMVKPPREVLLHIGAGFGGSVFLGRDVFFDVLSVCSTS